MLKYGFIGWNFIRNLLPGDYTELLPKTYPIGITRPMPGPGHVFYLCMHIEFGVVNLDALYIMIMLGKELTFLLVGRTFNYLS